MNNKINEPAIHQESVHQESVHQEAIPNEHTAQYKEEVCPSLNNMKDAIKSSLLQGGTEWRTTNHNLYLKWDDRLKLVQVAFAPDYTWVPYAVLHNYYLEEVAEEEFSGKVEFPDKYAIVESMIHSQEERRWVASKAPLEEVAKWRKVR